ncbi:FAD-dependent monooxygenase [Corallococcus sp. M34]|uniref:FAD-dependent monooxygenase n=1 Tax=Citreicoccus inhibens TaxID=2849499 RepID=UPI001C225776|nr:FAD-dependent monooxygenase [Citreicoccus inhibens]MBU8899027.1 FAD-dependent monooxygenase [Citreicoccus inhibens]
MKTVLISGASIAGPALAWWLRHHGFAPTVVEQAPAPRMGGQAIDIRGTALQVIERMGFLAEAQRVRTRMKGMSVLDPDGNEVMRTTEMTFSAGPLDSDDLELLREDLTRMLLDSTRPQVEYRFGDSITALAQDARGVHVAFKHGPPRDFDLVVGADGLHSNVRRHAFGPESDCVRPLGTQLAIFRAENFLNLDHWQVWMRDGDAGFGIYPVRDNTELRITVGFGGAPQDTHSRDPEAQKRLVAERLAHLRWETPRILRAMWDAPDFYFDAMAQVHLERWSSGRVALLGDAAWCASPLSGQGTSMALVGAYVLAEELARAQGDYTGAFRRYEERLRPFIALNQALATENPGGRPSEASIARASHAICLDAPAPASR